MTTILCRNFKCPGSFGRLTSNYHFHFLSYNMKRYNAEMVPLSLPNMYLCREPITMIVPRPMIKRIVNNVMGLQNEEVDRCPPYQRLANSGPSTFGPKVDLTRAKLAFGRWALPKLRRELLCKNKQIVNEALGSLKDIVYDPEMACEVLRLRVHIRLVRLIVADREYVRQRTLKVLTVLSDQPGGRLELAENKYILENMAKVLIDPAPSVRLHASHFLLAMAQSWLVVRKLVEAKFIKLVLKCILGEEETLTAKRVLMEALELMLDDGMDARVQGIAYDGLLLVDLLDDICPGMRRAAASVMSQLFQHPIGRVAAVVHGVIARLVHRVCDEVISVALEMSRALMFATISTEGRKEAAKSSGVFGVLLGIIMRHGMLPELQLNCAKCLTNLAELPSVRATLRPHVDSIRSQTYMHNSEPLCRAIVTLVDTILWEP